MVRFRDKGIPADNVSNYDSASEKILLVAPMEQILAHTLLFVTRQGMCKQVAGTEFETASRRTIASTKLAEGDQLVFAGPADEMDQAALVSHKGYILRFLKQEIPVMKKTAIGNKGMKLSEDDYIEQAFLLESRREFSIPYKGKTYNLSKTRLGKRGGAGTKPRV